MPNWDDVRVFLALARSGTLLGAGKLLRVNHTTVARRLAALESDLGTRLFDRTPDGYVATPAGDAISSFAEAMEDRYYGLEREISGHDARLAGVVRIATTDTFASMFCVPRVLPAIRAAYPDVDVELVSALSAFDLPRRQADLAIRMTRPTEQRLVVRKLGTLAFGLYGSRDYFSAHSRPRSTDDLAGQGLVGYDREAISNVGARWLDQTAGEQRAAVRCDHIMTVFAAALAGQGLAVLPCFLACGRPELERIGAPVASHDIWLVQHPDLQRTPRIRAVTEVIVSRFERCADELSGKSATFSPDEGPRYSRPDRAAKRRAPARSRR